MKALTAKEMSTLDNEMIKIGINVSIMMEYAGLFSAIIAAKITKGNRILVMVGTGNNGGDALVAARHLMNWNYQIDLVFASKSKLKPIPLQQFKILKKMDAKVVKNVSWKKYDLIVDGLLGYNLNGNPRGNFAKLIIAANNSKVPILAIDIPSGLDATSGKAYSPCIKASVTVTLAATKVGLTKKSAKKFKGKVYVSYLSIPEVIRKNFNLKKFTPKLLFYQI